MDLAGKFKSLLDPNQILNPYKLLPAGNRYYKPHNHQNATAVERKLRVGAHASQQRFQDNSTLMSYLAACVAVSVSLCEYDLSTTLPMSCCKYVQYADTVHVYLYTSNQPSMLLFAC